MKPLPPIPIVLLALLCACASSYEIEHDWDVEAPFADYHSYAWLERDATASRTGNDADDARLNSDLLDRRIRGAVDDTMKQKGIAVSDDPDLRAIYHVALKDKIDVTDWDYEYSGNYRGWAGRDIGVYTREEGTLIVDLIDAGTGQMVWRGVARGAVQPGQSPEDRDRTIREAVADMFKKFPPPR